jgi:putative transposase
MMYINIKIPVILSHNVAFHANKKVVIMTQKGIISEPVLNSLFNSPDFLKEAMAKFKSGHSFTGKDGILTPLIKQIVDASLDGEMEQHLEECSQNDEPNRRNGKLYKTLKTADGQVEIETPRDRAGTFEPQLIKKRQTILNDGLDDKILALYGLGMSYEDIRKHMQEMYSVEVSAGLLSKITDKLLPIITEWRNRPLESIYTIVFLDAMFFKAREDGKVITKTVYNILGINQYGLKDILGFYISDAEGAHFWLGVLNDLKARGVEDILIACIDGLKGFPEAIAASFPKTEVQLCIVHQIRHSIKYVGSKHQKEFMRDLKTVYRADTKDLAEQHLIELDDKWGKQYPMVLKSWQSKWEHLSAYFKYSAEIRRLIYTTNAVEGFHRQVRKYTKSKGAFTSENALVKLIYSAYQRIAEKWNQPMHNWALIVSQLDIYFESRLNIGL